LVAAAALVLPAAAAAAPSASEFPVCTNGSAQVSPAVSGTRVVWVDYRSGGASGSYPDAEIYARTLGGAEALVADTPNTYQVDVSGTYAVWFQGVSAVDTGADIYGIDLSGGAAFPVSTALADQYSVAISGNNVVWEDTRNGANVNEDIYGCTLPGVANFPVCDALKQQRNPAVDGDLVVWQDYRNGNWDIYGRRLSGGAEFPICTSAGDQTFPAVSGDLVVWQDYVGGAAGEDVRGYDLSTSTAFDVCTLPGDQEAPAISGDIVVWADMRNAPYPSLNSDIYGYDLASKTEFPICINTYTQTVPDISGSTVVWTDRRNGNDDIYGATLSGVTPPAVAPTSSSTYPFAATASSGWRNSDQTLTISATGGTPPLTINYSLDGGATWQTVSGATANVKVGAEGSHRFQYFASCAGAAEVKHDAGYVNIDKTRPVTTAYGASVKKGKSVKLGFKVGDASPGCGQARATLRIYLGKKLKKTLKPPVCATNAKTTLSWKATLAKGRYTLKVYATDAAGNAQSKVGSAKLTIR
jgi:beta propeller repeat protein